MKNFLMWMLFHPVPYPWSVRLARCVSILIVEIVSLFFAILFWVWAHREFVPWSETFDVDTVGYLKAVGYYAACGGVTFVAIAFFLWCAGLFVLAGVALDDGDF